MKINLQHLLLFIKMSRPLYLLGAALLYGLGAAMASFLDYKIDPGLYWIGQGIITFIQLMTYYLHAYYEEPSDRENENRTPLFGVSGVLGPEGLPRLIAMYAAIACVGIVGTLTSVTVVRGSVQLLAWLILLVGFAGAFLYSVPPVRLSTSGYGELTASVLVASLLPSFAFVLQTGELHRLLLLSTTPLIALLFAMLIAFQLPEYASDVKYDKQTLMVRIGWSAAMRLHDIAILFAIGCIIVASLLGLPLRVALGSLIVLPLALAQIWQFGRIRRGFPVRWRPLTLSAAGLFTLAAYLQLIGYLNG